MVNFGVPTPWRLRKATPGVSLSRGTSGPRAVRDPVHVPKDLTREPGGPVFDPGKVAPGSAP